jgi:uncharacterized membrane protein YcaP (DUF421 family)
MHAVYAYKFSVVFKSDESQITKKLMNTIFEIFGHGKNLDCMQMGCRGIVIFLFALILIRISGRRSFGIRSALDNIIVILLGTVLGRAIVGASAFLPVMTTCLIIVLLHRFFGWLIAHIRWTSKLIEGDKILLFKEGNFIKENLSKGLVCKEDVMQGVRKSALTDQLDKIEKIFIERNGEISAIKKDVE